MVLRQSSRLMRLYKRAYKRRSLPSYLPATRANSEFPITGHQGSFSEDFSHYQSHAIATFQPGQLSAFDFFVRQNTVDQAIHPLETFIYGIAPAAKPLQDFSQSRNWETFQSLTYDLWQHETIRRAQPARLAAEEEEEEPPKPKVDDPELQKANKRKENLANIANTLSDNLPKFFTGRHNYSIYSQDVIFENRIRDVTTQGLQAYVVQLNKYKSMAHLIYSHVRMDVLKITEHPEDSTVRVRWRIQTIGGVKPFLQFWKLFSAKKTKELVEYVDGFSTFVVGEDGLVHKHLADKMMPDDETVKKAVVPEKLAKLAAFVGFMLPLAIIE